MNLQSLVSFYYVSASGNISTWSNGSLTPLGTIEGNLHELPALHALSPSWLTIVTPFGNRTIHCPAEATYRPQIVWMIQAAIEVLVSRLVTDYQGINSIVGDLIFPEG